MVSVFVNGQSENTVQALDRGLAYGDGAFATMRVAQGQILFLNEHLDRLQQACHRLGFNIQDTTSLIHRLSLHAQTLTHGCIKLLLSRGVGGRGYTAPESPEVCEVISLHELPAIYAQWQTNGIALALSPVALAKQPLLAGMKHLNRLEQVLIKQQALPQGVDDWLVLDTDDHVIESSMANVFIVKGNQVITPTMSHSGVSGVMREQIIDALLKNNIEVLAQTVTLSDLQNADHVFISNSLLGMVNINHINLGTINANLSSKHHYKPWGMTHNLLTQLKLLY
ncbi:aminodeoxychorismate lyase [Shewanella sp. KT0246]|uniref:aminodeoxychorismate lyase n=1 Tax=Shewanella sp. KT0246 TaxID=2815912 RepID=UPI001BC64930|nr:aminodeoxychorismate lyase [Shewanella sp. KT0246]GIU53294.1 4-amino-4-deoxychorismate lyase [Shewanella sp. KT0246]